MNNDAPTRCPFTGEPVKEPLSLDGYERPWDLAESADAHYPMRRASEASLADSAQEAWRNAVRCVGRRLWKALQVIDARTLSQSDEIFEALVAHLRKATNGGKIHPVMTVFREWLPDQPEIRVWNPQLIRYAGYRGSDGTVLGDPMNVDLTQVAISLGWRPPSEPGPFDLLPVIIQTGQQLNHYELPRSEIREVRIRHPRYPFIEKMNLRWYAVPMVSDMVFATGSALHPCAPFNGYYLGTEIGARNLADSNRYNLLPEVATGLGLDMTNSRTLWKDHALVVLNEAVLWSFDHEEVRMADHHGVTEDFQKFCAQEEKAGREVSAEWSWIVPPVSGSTTPVFHQSYQLEPVYPNFLLQVPAWETERGKDALSSISATQQESGID